MLLLLCIFLTDYHQYKYSAQAGILGILMGSAISCSLRYGYEGPLTAQFCRYAFVFCVFHASEFFMTGITNNDALSPDSFLLNHSTAYWVAAAASWVEFAVESYLFPSFYSTKVSYFGFGVCICGEAARKLAMWHAASGFTHQVRIRKHKNHELVTTGIYAWVRHPGYLGWLLWSVGTQLILCNPFCVVAYGYVTFHFFDERIYDEERYLIEFFGQRYIRYQKRVSLGIPGIKGFGN
ncbi:Protein M01E11.1 [Aphelenchoides avenae]|nr:Protein M01E11.1 [Aphelenchus avenae]